MPRISLLLLSAALAASSLAEELPIQADSLKKELNAHAQHDTTRVNLLIVLSTSIQHSNPTDAARYAEEALSISEDLKWNKGIARSLGTLGNIHHIMTDYITALDYFQKAMRAADMPSNKLFEATILNNMAMIQTELSDFGRAIESYRTALALFQELGIRRGEAVILMNMGVISYRQHNHNDALAYSERSLRIAEDSGYVQVAAFALSTIGLSLVERGEMQGRTKDVLSATTSLRRSLELARTIGDTRVEVQSLGGLGQAYVLLEEFNRAEQNLTHSLNLAKSINSLQYEREAYEWLSRLYEKQQRSDKALTAYKNYVLLRDSILNDEKRQEIRYKEMQFAFDKKEALLNAQHQKEQELASEKLAKQQVQNNSVMGAAALLLIVGVTVFLLYKKRKEAEFRMRVTETEMKALRAQMNPHFIFNSLNSIGDFIAKHDMAKADYYLTKFAKLMRMILEHSEQKEVALSDDLRALELYMELEAMRLNNKFVYEVHVDEAIDKETTLVPPLLLQPFVENSIWHGIAPKQGNGKIDIRIERQNGTITCIVQDDGVGRKHADSTPAGEQKQSMGMKITRTRIGILNQIKHSNATIEIMDLPQGTRVQVNLPHATS